MGPSENKFLRLCDLAVSAWLLVPLALAILLAAPFAWCGIEELQAQFEHEPDPVRKAKIEEKLGAAELEEVRRLADAGDMSKALLALGSYRDQILAAEKALNATGVDVEKHPAGYKELQISLRGCIRKLNDIILTVPPEWKMGFDDLRRELESVDQKLILQLFPRQPNHQSKKGNPKP